MSCEGPLSGGPSSSQALNAVPTPLVTNDGVDHVEYVASISRVPRSSDWGISTLGLTVLATTPNQRQHAYESNKHGGDLEHRNRSYGCNDCSQCTKNNKAQDTTTATIAAVAIAD
jgi:hypothetical protein